MFSEKVIKRFLSKVRIGHPDECWEWMGSKIRVGYGYFWIGSKKNGKQHRAHRVSWQIFNNRPIPDELYVLHRCDNPGCVNPFHLFLGTQKDNSDDMRRKGRAVYPQGETHGFAKLTQNQVNEIRQRYALLKITQKQLAEEYNVHRVTIWQVLHRKCWKRC